MAGLAERLVAGGLLPLVILWLVAAEAVGLYVLRRRFGIGPGLAAMAGSLASGAMLVLALHLALAGGRAEAIVACLAGSFAVHLADLGWRLRAGGPVIEAGDEGLRTGRPV